MQPPEDPQTTPPDGFTLIPPVQTKKPHHWYRPRNIAIGTAALLVGIVVAGVAAGSSGDQPTVNPQVTASQPLRTASPAQPVSTPSSAGSVEGWLLGQGYKNLTTVQADVASVSTDANAKDVTAVEQDGQKLSTDAAAAALTPPPFDPEDYTAAMGKFQRAGDLMQRDDFTGATRYLDQGSALIAKVTASIPTPGA